MEKTQKAWFYFTPEGHGYLYGCLCPEKKNPFAGEFCAGRLCYLTDNYACKEVFIKYLFRRSCDGLPCGMDVSGQIWPNAQYGDWIVPYFESEEDVDVDKEGVNESI